MRICSLRWSKQFHVVHFRISFRVQCPAHAPCIICEPLHISELKLQTMALNQEKPISTPGNVAHHAAKFRHVDLHAFCFSVTGHISYRRQPVLVEFSRYHADWRFQANVARCNPAEVQKRGYHSNCSVPAHSEKPHIIEENNCRGTRWIEWLKQQSPNQ